MTLCAASLPDRITAGLDFQAVVSLPDYPATAWVLAAILRGPQPINLSAIPSYPDGDSHSFSELASTTSTWIKGTYWYSLRVAPLAGGSPVIEVGSGQLQVLPDLAAITTPYDGRSQNQIALDALDAVIAKRATLDQQRYKINERELWRTPMADLLKLRAYYATQVARERAKASGRSRFGRPVIVKFSQR